MAATYGPEHIHLLTGVQAIRKRPGMYVGDVTDATGLHQLVWNVIDHMVALHLAGHADELHVELVDGWLVARDNGPGISLDPVGYEDRPFVTALFTQMNMIGASGMFIGRYPLERRAEAVHDPRIIILDSISPGMLVAVSALSSRLEVETTRDGVRWAAAFERGEVIEDLHRRDPPGRGTTIRFHPDPAILGDGELEPARIAKRLNELARFLPRLRVTFQGEVIEGCPTEKSEARFAATGVASDSFVDVSLVWRGDESPTIDAFVNLGATGAGPHVDAIWRALASVAGRLAERRVGRRQVRTWLGPGLVATVHVGLQTPRFTSWRREQLENPEAGVAVERVLRDEVPKAIDRDESLKRFLLARLIR